MNSIILNGQEAAMTESTFESNYTIVYAIQFGEADFIVLTAYKAQPFTANESRLIEAIAESIRYNAGAIPQSNE